MNGRSRAWALALLVAVFLLGGLAGAVGDRMLSSDSAAPTEGRRGSDRERKRDYLDWLSEELGLSEEQQAQVRAIAERHRDQVSALWREMRPRFEELQAQARSEIRAVLTEEQQAAYDDLLQEQRNRHQRDLDRRHGNREEDDRS